MAGSPVAVERMGNTVNQLVASVTALVGDIELLRAAIMAHTHDGVTVGAGVTGTPTAAVGAIVAINAAAKVLGFTITQRYTFN